MANPFGIEQVDIPGLLGLNQQMKQRRLEELYRGQQMQIAEREADMAERKAAREDAKQAALAKIFMSGSKGGDLPSGSAGAPASSPTASAPTTLPGLEQDLPPRTDGIVINQQALRELYALDPQTAQQVQKFVYDADENALKQASARGEAMAVAAQALAKVPLEARGAELQKWAPFLVERGYGPQQLAAVTDLSDAALSRFFNQGRKIEQIVQSAEGDRNFSAQERERQLASERAARAEGRAINADRRSAVRFNERNLDRAALAASGGGVRTDLSDLDY